MSLNMFRRRVSINPAVTASSAYAAGNQLGPAATVLSEVFEGPTHLSLLQSIVIVDAANQKSAIDFLFFNTLPTVTSTDKTAFALTAAELKAKLVGSVSVASGDYLSTSAQGLASKANLQLPVQSKADTNNPRGRDLYVALICRGTPTYAATTDLVVDFIFQ